MSNPDSPADDGWIGRAVERYERPLLGYARQLTGDLERARDIVQDTFLRLCRQAPGSLDGHLAEWLYTVCRNRALDVRRKESRMTTISPDRAPEQPSREPAQAQAAELQDSVRHILELLDELPENQREVVRLKFQGGLSYQEISRVTQLSVSNVGYLLHVALQRLRRELNPEAAGP